MQILVVILHKIVGIEHFEKKLEEVREEIEKSLHAVAWSSSLKSLPKHDTRGQALCGCTEPIPLKFSSVSRGASPVGLR